MRKLSKRGGSSVDEENPYWISFSDIMSGLLVVFILASLTLIVQLMEKKSQVNDAIEDLAKAEQARHDILYEIKKELEKNNITVEVTDNDSVLRVPDDQLTFRSDRYDVPRKGDSYKRARLIGEVLYKSVVKDNRQKYLDTVFIEGHTDSQRSRAFKQMGNWGLSTFRAISVWQFWNKELGENTNLASIQNHEGLPLFSVSGYAAQRRVVEQEIERIDFQKNRRIDIRFTVKRPKLSDYQGIIEI